MTPDAARLVLQHARSRLFATLRRAAEDIDTPLAIALLQWAETESYRTPPVVIASGRGFRMIVRKGERWPRN